jgi:hypothetical protein
LQDNKVVATVAVGLVAFFAVVALAGRVVHGYAHGAAFGRKFDGVGREVVEDLSQTTGVTYSRVVLYVDLLFECDLLFLGLRRQHVVHLADKKDIRVSVPLTLKPESGSDSRQGRVWGTCSTSSVGAVCGLLRCVALRCVVLREQQLAHWKEVRCTLP